MKKNFEKRKPKNADFQSMAKSVNMILQEVYQEELTFKGYSDFIRSYLNLQDIDISGSFKLAIDANLWANYMSEVCHYIEYRMFCLEIELDKLKSTQIPRQKNEELDTSINTMTNKCYNLKLFYLQLKNQVKFLEMAHRESLAKHKKGVNKLLYMSN